MNLYANSQSAYVSMPETNSSYLYRTKGVDAPKDPISGSTVGLMAILSSFQYQAPYMNSKYSNAAEEAGNAAFIECGGKEMQDKLISKITSDASKKGSEFAHYLGITNLEMIFVAGTYKIIKNRQIDLNGPKIFSTSTHLSLGETGGNIGIRYEW